jgi:hypothetical protein
MKPSDRVKSMLLSACLAAMVAVPARAQTPDFLTGEATNAPIVKGAPFSAESLVTVKMTLFDGTQMERSVRARQYRDSAGRVRREQTVIGLDVLNPAKDWQAIVTIVDPVAGFIYTIIPGTKTAQRMAIPQNLQAPQRPASLPAAQEERLGTKDIDGIQAAGYRTRTTIPTGLMGNDRPIEITDERWESVDLKIVVSSRHHDPRSGDVEYRLIGISRSEPAQDLFRVPAGHKIVDIPPRSEAR